MAAVGREIFFAQDPAFEMPFTRDPGSSHVFEQYGMLENVQFRVGRNCLTRFERRSSSESLERSSMVNFVAASDVRCLNDRISCRTTASMELLSLSNNSSLEDWSCVGVLFLLSYTDIWLVSHTDIRTVNDFVIWSGRSQRRECSRIFQNLVHGVGVVF